MTFDIGPELAGVLEALAFAGGIVGVVWAICWCFSRASFEIRFRDPDEKGE